jgi:hypothetical protein
VAVGSADDLGKTYFDGFIQVRPQNSLTLTLQYTTPTSDYSTGGKYPLMIQKQGGTIPFPYSVKVGGSSKSFNLSGDQNLSL